MDWNCKIEINGKVHELREVKREDLGQDVRLKQEGNVVLCSETGTRYFLKYTKDKNQIRRLEREASMKRICSPYLLRIYGGVKFDSDYFGVISEYLEDAVNLAVFEEKELKGKDAECEKTRYEIILNLLYGIKAYSTDSRKMQVYHRDLKPENIMICRRSNGGILAKIIDFDWAYVRDMGEDVTEYNRLGGTPEFTHPFQHLEGWDESKNTLQLDLFSAALVMYFILEGALYFDRTRLPWGNGKLKKEGWEASFCLKDFPCEERLRSIMQRMMTPDIPEIRKYLGLEQPYDTIGEVISDFEEFLKEKYKDEYPGYFLHQEFLDSPGLTADQRDSLFVKVWGHGNQWQRNFKLYPCECREFRDREDGVLLFSMCNYRGNAWLLLLNQACSLGEGSLDWKVVSSRQEIQYHGRGYRITVSRLPGKTEG